MPLFIQFEKTDAERFLRAIESGSSIDGEGAWTRNRLLTLAGACMFAAASHGPDANRVHAGLGVDPSEFHPEHREAIEEGFMHDLRATMDFVASTVMAVQDGDYDERFEPTFQALVSRDDGSACVVALRGFKGTGGGA